MGQITCDVVYKVNTNRQPNHLGMTSRLVSLLETFARFGGQDVIMVTLRKSRWIYVEDVESKSLYIKVVQNIFVYTRLLYIL